MYIIKVLIEHPVHSLDTTFDYLFHDNLQIGIRVIIPFGYQKIIGYVEEVEKTNLTQEQLEKKNGFRYQYIQEVIDEEPLLNQELRELALQLAKMTMSPRIACLQAMLPTQLKPSTHHAVGKKMKTVIQVLKDGIPQTKKQQECLQYLKEHPLSQIKDIPYTKGVVDHLKEQGFIEYQKKEQYRQPYVMDNKEQKNITLTKDQQKVVEGILSKKENVSLIHGVTGSGKTEVYLALASFVLK